MRVATCARAGRAQSRGGSVERPYRRFPQLTGAGHVSACGLRPKSTGAVKGRRIEFPDQTGESLLDEGKRSAASHCPNLRLNDVCRSDVMESHSRRVAQVSIPRLTPHNGDRARRTSKPTISPSTSNDPVAGSGTLDTVTWKLWVARSSNVKESPPP